MSTQQHILDALLDARAGGYGKDDEREGELRRRGEQKGSLRKINDRWYGSFLVYGRGKSCRKKCVALGRCDKTEARKKLLEIIKAETQQSVAVGCMNPAILTINRRIEVNPSVDGQVRGAIGELLVASDLLSRGYEVFRPLCAASSCDLAYIRDGHLVRVEVKFITGTTVRLWRNLGKFDVLALVYGDGRIEYRSHADISSKSLTVRQNRRNVAESPAPLTDVDAQVIETK